MQLDPNTPYTNGNLHYHNSGGFRQQMEGMTSQETYK